MTQVELEQIAREVRTRGLHSSWNELLEFSDSLVGSLVDAYQALQRCSVSSGTILSTNPSGLQVLLHEKIGKALLSLTSQEQVAKWESEALAIGTPDSPER
jgi:hypothetical protein